MKTPQNIAAELLAVNSDPGYTNDSLEKHIQFDVKLFREESATSDEQQLADQLEELLGAAQHVRDGERLTHTDRMAIKNCNETLDHWAAYWAADAEKGRKGALDPNPLDIIIWRWRKRQKSEGYFA